MLWNTFRTLIKVFRDQVSRSSSCSSRAASWPPLWARRARQGLCSQAVPPCCWKKIPLSAVHGVNTSPQVFCHRFSPEAERENHLFTSMRLCVGEEVGGCPWGLPGREGSARWARQPGGSRARPLLRPGGPGREEALAETPQPRGIRTLPFQSWLKVSVWHMVILQYVFFFILASLIYGCITEYLTIVSSSAKAQSIWLITLLLLCVGIQVVHGLHVYIMNDR